MAPDTGALIAAIYNDGRMVREFQRGGRLPGIGFGEKRSAAIRDLGLTVRAAFSQSEDFEPLLTALVDALVQRDDWPRF